MKTLNIKELKEAVIEMFNNDEYDHEAFELGLNILENKISEKDFTDFCNSL